MYAKPLSAIAVLSVLASATAQYHEDVYGRAVDADDLDIYSRDASEPFFHTFTTRDLEELLVRDPSFKSFIHKVKHVAEKAVHGVEHVAESIGKEAIDHAPQLVDAAKKLQHREAADFDHSIYMRSFFLGEEAPALSPRATVKSSKKPLPKGAKPHPQHPANKASGKKSATQKQKYPDGLFGALNQMTQGKTPRPLARQKDAPLPIKLVEDMFQYDGKTPANALDGRILLNRGSNSFIFAREVEAEADPEIFEFEEY